MTRQNTRIDRYKEGYQNRPLLHKLSYQQRLKRYLENTAVIPSTAFQTLLLTMMATPFLLRDSCLTEYTKISETVLEWDVVIDNPSKFLILI